MEDKNFKSIQECDIYMYNQLKNRIYITTYIKETVKLDEETKVPYVERIPFIVYGII